MKKFKITLDIYSSIFNRDDYTWEEDIFGQYQEHIYSNSLLKILKKFNKIRKKYIDASLGTEYEGSSTMKKIAKNVTLYQLKDGEYIDTKLKIEIYDEF